MRLIAILLILTAALIFAAPVPATAAPATTAQADGATTPDADVEQPAPEAHEERSRGGTWIMLGVLVGILLAGLIVKSRIDRSARSLVEKSEQGGEDS